MSEEEIKIGDLVWAKMKGFSPWPGKITEPFGEMKKPKSNKPMHCVWFFGSNNYAWIEDYCIKPYQEHRTQLISTCKTALFKDAVAAIDDYITRKEAGEDVDREFAVDREEEPEIGEQEPITENMAQGDEGNLSDEISNEMDMAVKKRRVTGETDSNGETGEEKKTTPKAKREKARSEVGVPVPKRRKKPTENGDTVSQPEGVKTPKKRVRRNSTQSAPAIPASSKTSVSGAVRKSAASNLLDRPSSLKKPDTAPIDVSQVTQTLKNKKISPSELRFGFLGLGNIGSGIVKNLLHSGHHVIVWNRTPEKCKDFVDAGADQGLTPSDVIASADITFSCVADSAVSKEMVFGNCGVLSEITASKGYVEMTGVDAEFSQDIADAIASKGGRYLEAQLQGSKAQAEEGALIILAAGDRSLFDDCFSPFGAMSRTTFFLGDVGNAAKMNLVLQLIQGVALTGLSEGMALADRCNLQAKDVLEILQLTSFASKMIKEKGEAIIDGSFGVQQPLQHMQKDLNMSLALGNQMEQPLPVTASANEVFKHAKRLGYGEHDASAVYIRARF